MDTERNPRRGQVPLPGFAETAAAEAQALGSDGPALDGQAEQSRKVGIRQVRRMSNWTAAALIVGTGATTIVLAQHAFPVGTTATSSVSSTTGTTGLVTTGTTQGTRGPQVSHSVATTSASGVTVTTTSKVVNGKTVVSQVRNVPANHGD